MKVSLCFVLLFFSLTLFSQDIFNCARHGNVERMKLLTSIKLDTVNARNENEFTPLIIAGYWRQIDAVEFLLLKGADINANSPEGPVIVAASYRGDSALVNLLLHYKPKLELANSDGITALMYSAIENHADVAKTLIEHGAKKTSRSKAGLTAYDYAAMRNNIKIMELMSDKK